MKKAKPFPVSIEQVWGTYNKWILYYVLRSIDHHLAVWARPQIQAVATRQAPCIQLVKVYGLPKPEPVRSLVGASRTLFVQIQEAAREEPCEVRA